MDILELEDVVISGTPPVDLMDYQYIANNYPILRRDVRLSGKILFSGDATYTMNTDKFEGKPISKIKISLLFVILSVMRGCIHITLAYSCYHIVVTQENIEKQSL